MDIDLIERLERAEAYNSIQQLAARYALYMDSRDIEGLGDLFVGDTNMGPLGRGRSVLQDYYRDHVLCQYYRSIHNVYQQIIDFKDSEHAEGKVYCRAEHEDGDRWVAMAIIYDDRYVRREGKWYFNRRTWRHFYACDVLERPGQPTLHNWPSQAEQGEPKLPQAFNSWGQYWDTVSSERQARLTRSPVR